MSNPAAAIQQTCDAYFSGEYRRLLRLLFAGTVLFTVVRGYQLARDWEQWVVGEWLISYSKGFVRRGLSGEVLLRASAATGVSANLLVFLTIVVLFIAFVVLFARLIRRKTITFWYLFLCLSPAFLLFTVYNPDAIGRQELIVYVLFLLWAHLIARGTVTSPTIIAFGVLCFVATLAHELFSLYVPYFVLLPIVLARLQGKSVGWPQVLAVPAGAGLAVLVLLLFGRSLDEQALCERILRTGAPADVCGGILAYGDAPPTRLLADFVGHLNAHVVFSLLLVFPVVLLPAYVFLAANRHPGIAPPKLIALLTLFILLTAPLFVMAVDWGRWVSIHTVLLTIVCAHFLQDGDASPATAPQRVPAGAAAAHVTLGLLIVSSTLLWNVKYCCNDDYFNPLGPIRTIENAWASAP
jgi:hypothetical protein